MAKPLVSVIVPVYNHAQFVADALLSVVRQSYRPIELIVIDDGSTDGSADVAQRVLDAEMPGAILIRRANRGAHNTINQGLRLAGGAYLTVLNSDDSYGPDRIKRCMEVIEQTGSEFLFTDVGFMDDDGRPMPVADPHVQSIRDAAERSRRFPTVGFALLKNQLGVTTGNFVFSRRLLDKLGGFRPYRYVHDWDFILRALFHVEPFYLREPLYNYRLHGTNSFKAIGVEQEGYETAEVMRNFLWLMTSRPAENARAPCPYYWPGFFDWFIGVWHYAVYMPPSWRAKHLY